MMVDFYAFINDSLNPGLKAPEVGRGFGKIRSFTVFCDCATLLGSELLLFPWLLWVVLPAEFIKC